MLDALRDWAQSQAGTHPDILRIGCIGSYARGDWGVGSDLDIVIILRATQTPFERRSAEWDATDLPVPADVIVYTEDEIGRLPSSRMRTVLADEAVWVYPIDSGGGPSVRLPNNACT